MLSCSRQREVFHGDEHEEMEKRFMMKAEVLLSVVLFLRLLQPGKELSKASVKQYMNFKL